MWGARATTLAPILGVRLTTPNPTPLDPKRPSGECAMFKFVLAVALTGLLAACSGMSTSSYSADEFWGASNPPRSAGEGPSFHPVYP
jgi:hypothetical protein